MSGSLIFAVVKFLTKIIGTCGLLYYSSIGFFNIQCGRLSAYDDDQYTIPLHDDDIFFWRGHYLFMVYMAAIWMASGIWGRDKLRIFNFGRFVLFIGLYSLAHVFFNMIRRFIDDRSDLLWGSSDLIIRAAANIAIGLSIVVYADQIASFWFILTGDESMIRKEPECGTKAEEVVVDKASK